jgi:hypothetical protein
MQFGFCKWQIIREFGFCEWEFVRELLFCMCWLTGLL